MLSRRSLPVVLAIMPLLGMVHAEDRVQSELKFVAHNKAEKTAGVWVDGQYVGFVKELTGDKKIVLLPGKHEVLVRQAWYRDHVEQVILEPGKTSLINVSLVRDEHPNTREATGEFDGVGKAMLLTPGRHSVRVALPGYLPFETVVDLRPHQKLKLQTDLVKGSITEAGSLVNQPVQ